MTFDLWWGRSKIISQLRRPVPYPMPTLSSIPLKRNEMHSRTYTPTYIQTHTPTDKLGCLVLQVSQNYSHVNWYHDFLSFTLSFFSFFLLFLFFFFVTNYTFLFLLFFVVPKHIVNSHEPWVFLNFELRFNISSSPALPHFWTLSSLIPALVSMTKIVKYFVEKSHCIKY